MRQWLLDDLRLDPEWLSAIALSDVRSFLVTGFKRRELGALLGVLERLQQELAA